MLEIKDLEVYYGVIQAIKGISFEVNQGEVIALIGANGAGKTTTLQTITGMLQAKKGQIIFEGKDITRVPGHKIVSMGMAHVPERNALESFTPKISPMMVIMMGSMTVAPASIIVLKIA